MPDSSAKGPDLSPVAARLLTGAPPNEQRTGCSLCGLPVGRSGIKQVIHGQSYHFCCLGCSHVFQILFHSPEGNPPGDLRETELYKACAAAGLVAAREVDPAKREANGDRDEGPETTKRSDDAIEEGLSVDMTLRVEGMWCSSCSWLIEEVLRKGRGVLRAEVAFLSDLARIKYLPHLTTLQDILAPLSRLGYRAFLLEDPSKRTEDRDLLLRLGTSAILTVNIMMISFALYSGFFEELEAGGIRYLSYPLWLLATPVVFICGFPILRRASLGLIHLHMSMDTLIAMGVLSAYVYSVVGTLNGSLHLYFDTASMLVTLVLLGRFIERRAKDRVSAGIRELHQLAGGKVRLCGEGKERWVSTESVQPGDEFLVLASERISVDGAVVAGRGRVDESIITGESRPISRAMGDHLTAGALLMEGRLRLRALKEGNENSINQMIGLMEQALSAKNPVELMADRITRGFVPFVFLLAALTALILLHGGATTDEALLRALTVLVITCPCALGIATPLAKTAFIEVGRKRGILVRDPGALESARELDVILFDKTGTLTQGDFTLMKVAALRYDRNEVLRRVASVEAQSDHLLAREILRKIRGAGTEIEEAQDFRSHEGLGVSGIVRGEEVVVGNRELMKSRGMMIEDGPANEACSWESRGCTTVFFGWDGKVEGFLVFGDAVKENAGRTVSQLAARGISVRLVSGDSRETTRAVADELGIEEYMGQAHPAQKVEIIGRLQGQGHRVGMVGDGINDAAALARADVGIALGAGSDITREASDITLMAPDPARVVEVLELSAMTTRIIRQNLFFAFLYNLLAIPLAVAGLLNPLVAVLAMFASSLTVMANTLRISYLYPSRASVSNPAHYLH